MAEQFNETRVTASHDGFTFRFPRLFRGFSMAVQPGKLVLALLIVLAMMLVGWVMDGVFGGARVQPNEFITYVATDDAETFDQRMEAAASRIVSDLARIIDTARPPAEVRQEVSENLRDSDTPHALAAEAVGAGYEARREAFADRFADDEEGLAERLALIDDAEADALARIDDLRPRGVFQTVQQIIGDAFADLVAATGQTLVTFEPAYIGFDQLNPAEPLDQQTIIGALRTVVCELPGWLWTAHPWYLVIWLIVFVVIWSLLGGAISRMAAVEAATGEPESVAEGIGFSSARWFTYAVTPLLPLIFAGGLALLLAVVGLMFHVPVLNVLGALLWIGAIVVGLAMSFLLIAWVGGVHLIYPSISTEGTDGFDAVSRSFSYVLHRPWRFVTYTLLAIGYGAITYLFVGVVIFLTLYLAQQATAAWSPFAELYPEPRLGQLRYELDYSELNWTERVAAVLIWVWTTLVVSIGAAYAISYYFCVYSQAYLLLRRQHDGTDEGQVFIDPTAEHRRAADAAMLRDKLEPTGRNEQANATAPDQ